MSKYLLPVLIKRQSQFFTASVLLTFLCWSPIDARESAAVYSTVEGESLYLPGPVDRKTESSTDSSRLNATTSAGSPVVLMTEDFEGVFPSGSWFTPADEVTNCSWAKTSSMADSSTASASPVAVGCSTAVDEITGPLPANAQIFMSFGPFDLSGKTTATLNFRHAIQLEVGDSLLFGHINDANCNGSYTISGIGGGNLSWLDRSMDLSSRAGNRDVCIAFILRTDEVVATGDEAVFVDNIEIVAGTSDVDLALTLVDVENGTFAPGDTISVRTIVENLGTETSSSYDIRVFLSEDSHVTNEDFFLGSLPNPGLAAGGKDDYTFYIPLPGDLPEEDWFIGANIPDNDTNQENNSNQDATPITVNSQAEIDIRPVMLSIFEPVPPSPNLTGYLQKSQALDSPLSLTTSVSVTQAKLKPLIDQVRTRGQLSLLVGLDTGFVPEGRLGGVEIQRQRVAISSATDRLLSGLGPYVSRLKHRFSSIPFVALQVDEAALMHLSNSPMVTSLSEDRLSSPMLADSNIVIGTPLAWAEGFDGSGWTVAVLDTGVDKSHSWFGNGGSKVVSEACYGNVQVDVSESFCPGGDTSSTKPGSGKSCDLSVNGCDHGTHVAGIVAGNDGVGPGFGVARGADIIAIQVFSKYLTEADCGTGDAPCILSSTSDQIAALERVLELSASMEIAAANMSLGDGRFFSQASCDLDEAATKAIIDNLRSIGIATVISSGNDGWDDSISAPACISSAISVAASSNDDKIASFSNVYPEIHLLAPGMSITSSEPGGVLGIQSGTSMSAPHVTGAWAVMQQRNPGSRVDEILAKLQVTAQLLIDQRVGGTETNLKRINLDLALGQPRSTFGIFNRGFGPLSITSITPDIPSEWISVEPSSPFDIQPGGLAVVYVTIDFTNAPAGLSSRRLLVESNDLDKSPFPEGVMIELTSQAVPMPKFFSSPVAGSTLDFSDVEVSMISNIMEISVQNTGNADLLLDCDLSGTHAAQFNIKSCSSLIAPSGSGTVSLECAPATSGAKSAFLKITTNDADEGVVSFTLVCNAIGNLPEEVIFADDFEV